MPITNKALPHLRGSAFITALRQINTVINIATSVDGVTCLQTQPAAVEILPGTKSLHSLFCNFFFNLTLLFYKYGVEVFSLFLANAN